MSARGGMLEAARGSWVLLLGFGVLMLGDGLQATLLGVRAALAEFPTAVTGLVMSAFYAGFLGGALWAPRIVERVGHSRAFGALASVASVAVLVHGVFVTPWLWAVLRLISGFCFAGIYVVTESWLNDRATNETRGQLLSVYMVVTYLGVAGGQLLLNVADPAGIEPFVLTSVLISLSLVPLLLSASAPGFESHAVLGLGALYRSSPLGVVGTAVAGLSAAGIFTMGPVYAGALGLGVADIATFMTVIVAGCLLLQWPIGHLSDRFDRRTVICVVTALAALAAALAGAGAGNRLGLYAFAGLFGGLALPMYALVVAHANDQLEPAQMVAAAGGLVLVGGAGAVLGPLAVSIAMEAMGPQGFFWVLASVHALLFAFALYRIRARPARPAEAQGGSVAAASLHGSWVALEAARSAAQAERSGETG